jgi:integrase
VQSRATRKQTFPLEVRRGFAVVKIYRSQSRGRIYFKVVYRDTGQKRKTRGFKTFSEAKTEADLLATKMSQAELDVLSLTNEDRLIYGRALHAINSLAVPLDVAATSYANAAKIIQDLGISIDVAAAEYGTARRRLEHVSLAEAADFYLKHHPRNVPKKSVQEVVSEFLEVKRAAGVSEVYIDDLEYRCQAFANHFPCAITEVTAPRIQEFLTTLKRRRTFKGSAKAAPLSKRTYNNFRSALRTLFDFAKRRRYVPKEFEEMDVVDRVKNAHSEIEIFSPAEITALLEHAGKMTAFIAIGGFAGLRHAEIRRLDWKEVDLKRDFIEVSKGKAKTAARRLVPIQSNLKAWLLSWSKASGPVCPVKDSNWQLKQIAKDAGVQWKHNALRHSFISYRVSIVQDVAKVALEAGNSPQVIFSNYRELVRPEEASAWFAVSPPSIANIVPLKAANE